MEQIENRTYDEERALYVREGLTLRHCRYDGPADGESACKECRDITVQDCYCNLRYPFWHVRGLRIRGTEMTPLCRAALWYSEDIGIADTKLHGIKALRECRGIRMTGCDIRSPEFGWSVSGLRMEDCYAESEYFMMRAQDLVFRGLELHGKYSFQYIRNAVFENCVLDTKDAFWHAENVTVRNSTVRGEYLGWYSVGLHFENCRITGTQPLCYCRGLRLDGCAMTDTDLCFERSEVEATITTPVVSIKNPLSGSIRVPAVESVIRDGAQWKGRVLLPDGER